MSKQLLVIHLVSEAQLDRWPNEESNNGLLLVILWLNQTIPWCWSFAPNGICSLLISYLDTIWPAIIKTCYRLWERLDDRCDGKKKIKEKCSGIFFFPLQFMDEFYKENFPDALSTMHSYNLYGQAINRLDRENDVYGVLFRRNVLEPTLLFSSYLVDVEISNYWVETSVEVIQEIDNLQKITILLVVEVAPRIYYMTFVPPLILVALLGDTLPETDTSTMRGRANTLHCSLAFCQHQNLSQLPAAEFPSCLPFK